MKIIYLVIFLIFGLFVPVCHAESIEGARSDAESVMVIFGFFGMLTLFFVMISNPKKGSTKGSKNNDYFEVDDNTDFYSTPGTFEYKSINEKKKRKIRKKKKKSEDDELDDWVNKRRAK